MPDRKVILLDEPLLGLDAIMRNKFYNLLNDSFEHHPRTIVLSTHMIDEVTRSAEQLISMLPENPIAVIHDYYQQELSVTLNFMSILTYILTAVMVVILCIALGNLNIVLFANRRDELTILHSIGFTKGKLSQKLWVENFLVCTGGYLVGVLITILFVWLLNAILLIPQGKVLEIIDWNGLIIAFALPAFISIFSLLPSLISNFRSMNKIAY